MFTDGPKSIITFYVIMRRVSETVTTEEQYVLNILSLCVSACARARARIYGCVCLCVRVSVYGLTYPAFKRMRRIILSSVAPLA